MTKITVVNDKSITRTTLMGMQGPRPLWLRPPSPFQNGWRCFHLTGVYVLSFATCHIFVQLMGTKAHPRLEPSLMTKDGCSPGHLAGAQTGRGGGPTRPDGTPRKPMIFDQTSPLITRGPGPHRGGGTEQMVPRIKTSGWSHISCFTM